MEILDDVPYGTYDEDGTFTNVYSLRECFRAIRVRNNQNIERIRYLEEVNKDLKDEHYKDEELSNMKDAFERMRDDYFRGFPISQEEDKAIHHWMDQHDKEVHNLVTSEQKMLAGGVSGGRFSYHFYPTGIDVFGVVKCSCGAEFTFKEDC